MQGPAASQRCDLAQNFVEKVVNSVVAINRRESEEQKALRRQTVLLAAEAYFLDVGYGIFYGSTRQERRGWSRARSIFTSKQEKNSFSRFMKKSLTDGAVFISNLSEPMSSEAYARTLHNTALADGTFVPLLIRLEHVIEHNVSIPRLIESKRAFHSAGGRCRRKYVESSHVESGASEEVAKTMGVLLIGATRTDQGPLLDDEELPADVKDLIAGFSSEPLFVKNAVRIIEGIRAEAITNSVQTDR